ncbi:response regulator [Salipiger sp. 1_MG-2023]|uniref:response regulator n=1 Tax=Salipiger sp. 1_MG-2023 TaxID=3062665 RepID=UPI0026E337AA|nr:response regulator [Salipiger sp. 1_MG-2023]MDO6585074.1 response regulator [Salipiger sp. 1_MG-2023]
MNELRYRAMTGNLTGASVLILEDEAIISFDLELTAQDMGAARTVCAFSLREAQAAMQAERFDAAILDVNLPDGSSERLALQLAQAGTLVIFHTGHGERETLCSQCPSAGFVAKPSSPQQIADELGRMRAATAD